MSVATMSILGLYNAEPNIFDNLVVPDGIDKANLIDNILIECAELEILFTNPMFMKNAIGVWSKKNVDKWQKLYDTTQFQYNPIWNKDGTVTEKETRDLTNTDGGEDSSTLNTNAFDSGTGTEREKNVNEYSNVNKDTGTIVRERKEKGNIGITTTQQMIKEEREVNDFNIYDFIIDDFKKRFCLLIY